MPNLSISGFLGMLVVLVLGSFSFTSAATAQEAPAWELHGGYQLLRADITDFRNSLNAATDASGIARLEIRNHLNAQGWDGSVQENVNRWFGGIIDVSGSYVKRDINIATQLQDAGLIGPNDKRWYGLSHLSTASPPALNSPIGIQRFSRSFGSCLAR